MIAQTHRVSHSIPLFGITLLIALAMVTLADSPGVAGTPAGSGGNAKALAAPATAPSVLKYGVGKPDGKRSLGGSGEMIRFTLPEKQNAVVGIRIHGSRYGTPQPPKEDFLVYILSEDRTQILHTESFPYKLFERGDEKWVTVSFKSPAAASGTFWVAVDFRARQTKGVYVSFDTSTGGKYSKAGLPGTEAADVTFGGDWMIQALVGNAGN